MFWAHYPLGLTASILCRLLGMSPAPGTHHLSACLGEPPAATPSLGRGQARAPPCHEARCHHSYFILSMLPWTLQRNATANTPRGALISEVQTSEATGGTFRSHWWEHQPHQDDKNQGKCRELPRGGRVWPTGCREDREHGLPSFLPLVGLPF